MSGSGSAAMPDPDRESGGSPAAADASASSQADVEQADTGAGDRDAVASQISSGAASHGQFLITSDERDAAEARLRQAVTDEVLSLEEFGDRMRLLLAAKTRGDLHRALADLPGTRAAPARTAQRGQVRPARSQGALVAILGSSETRGRWRPDRATTVVAVLGDATVDLQGAEYEDDELTINAFAMLGHVEIVVPEGIEVEMRGISILGDRTMRANAAVVAGAPVVRVDGLVLLGDITVRHPKARERFIPDDGRGPFADRLPPPTADQRADATARRLRRSRPGPARRWVGGLLVAAALALPFGWTLAADDVTGAVFGSTEHTVSATQLAAGDELSVGVPVAFGSVNVQVPEGVNVVRDGVVIFGSTSCEPCGAQVGANAPTVQIRTFGAFGSVAVTRPAGSGLQ